MQSLPKKYSKLWGFIFFVLAYFFNIDKLLKCIKKPLLDEKILYTQNSFT